MTIEHGNITASDIFPADAEGRGVHSIEGLVAVADETAREAITQVAGDRGRAVYQSGGTDPGWYMADGAGNWFYLSGALSGGLKAINDPVIARPDDFVLLDDFYKLDLDVWTKLEDGAGSVAIMIGDGSNGFPIQGPSNVAAGVLTMYTTSGDTAGVIDAVKWFNGSFNPVLRARIYSGNDVNYGCFNIGFADDSVLLGSPDNYAILYTDGNYWHTVCYRDGGTGDSEDEVLAASIYTTYDIRIELVPDTEIKFYIDDVLVSTLDATNSVPDLSSKLGRTIELGNSNGENIGAMVDYIDLRMPRGNYGGV